MSLEKKTGLFYEILIRGVHGAEPGKQLGEISGAHYIEGEAVVDTDTGEVVQYKPGVAQELAAEKVAVYLGDRFVAFEAQIRDMQKRLEAAETASAVCARERVEDISAKDAEIAAYVRHLDEIQQVIHVGPLLPPKKPPSKEEQDSTADHRATRV